MSFVLKNYTLVEVVYLFIRCNKTKFFLWNTNNTNRNGVNKQNTHLEKDSIGEEGGLTNYGPGCFWIIVFDSAREASNDVKRFWT